MLKILGDICFADGYFDKGKGIGSAIKTGVDPFKYLDCQDGDFWIGNFECVCADSEDDYFVISPSILDLVHHLDFYGVANNHLMQIGSRGYQQTIDYLESQGLNYAGSNKKRSSKFVHQNKKVGVLAFSMRPDNFSESPLYWHIPELADIKTEIDKLIDCDFRIAFIHWGYEFMNRPNIEQRQMAHWLVDSGIDLIIGMHSHVAQGSEIYKGKNIFYSLGNAVFNMPWTPTQYGLMVNVDFTNEAIKIWTDYIRIGEDNFPSVVTTVPEKFTRKYLDSLVNATTENEIYFAQAREYNSEYTKVNRKAILKRIISMPLNEIMALISDFVKRRIIHK